ncbi:MAG: hypothetical protein WKF84_02060 [Pyrinomonadaceae bacterium]
MSAGGAASAPALTEVEVLPALPSDGLSIGACVAPGNALARRCSSGGQWDAGGEWLGYQYRRCPAGASDDHAAVGSIQLPTTLPGLTFSGSAVVPLATANSSYIAAVSGGGTATFNIPCATSTNLPPLAVAGGPIYTARAGVPLTLNGAASSGSRKGTALVPLGFR